MYKDIFLLEFKEGASKLSFEKKIIALEFTELIGKMNFKYCINTTKRDIYLIKLGKKLFKNHPLLKNNKVKINIKIKNEAKGLTESEIYSILTPVNPNKLYLLGYKLNKIKAFFKDLCEWKLIIEINNLEYKICFHGLVRVRHIYNDDLSIEEEYRILKEIEDINKLEIHYLEKLKRSDAIMKKIHHEDQILLSKLRKQFGEATVTFESLLFPFSLTSITIKEGNIIKLQEEEKNELINDYEDFKRKVKIVIKSTSTFITNSLTENSLIIDNKFTKYFNENVASALTLYQNVLDRVKQEDAKTHTLIQNAYFAYIMLARLLNTGIHLYNKHNPNANLEVINNIPDPQYFDITINNVKEFFTNFFRTLIVN